MNQTNEYLLHITNTYTNFVNKIQKCREYISFVRWRNGQLENLQSLHRCQTLYIVHNDIYASFPKNSLSLNMYPKCTFTVHFIFVFKIFLTKKRSVDSKHALYCYLTSVVILLRVHTSIFKKRPIKYVKNALYPKFLLDK